MSLNSVLGVNELKNYKTLLKQLFAELIGTFLYLSIVVLVESDSNLSNITVGFANGLLVATIVQIIGNVSGGHINPAVTVGALICGHIKPLRALCYVAVQIIGAIAGAAVAYVISEPNTRGNLGATIPYFELRSDQVFAMELLMTFVLVAVTLSVMDVTRGARGLGSAPLAIGLSITACQCSCVSYTGSLNPVRSLGPALMMNIWTHHWVFWVGPLCGAALAGVTYRFVLNLNVNENVIVQE